METKLKSYFGKDWKNEKNKRIVMLENREEAGEDDFQCKYCTDLCFWSFIKCSVHTSPSTNDEPLSQAEAQQKQPKLSKRKAYKQKERQSSSQQTEPESEQYCIHHLGYCGCFPDNYTVVLRYTNKELEEFLGKIEQTLQNIDSKTTDNKRNSSSVVEIADHDNFVPKLKANAVVYSKSFGTVDHQI